MKQLSLTLLALLALLIGDAAAQTSPASPAAKPLTFDLVIQQQLDAALDQLEATGDADAARARIGRLFELVIARATDRQLDLFRQADFAFRLAEQMQELPPEQRRDLVSFLRQHEPLSHALVYLVRPGESARGAYAMLDRLRRQRLDQLDTYATLAAALCVVHDRPLERHINENLTRAPDPLDLFDYFVSNENQMAFGIRNVPAELLIYVVDATSSIDDMRWALQKYARDPKVGQHFFDIKYDQAYYQTGKDKKIDAVAYTLPNLLKYGGVCADQAYFATSIGKAIGVPTAYATGASAEVGHAWVGFFQVQANRKAWNFDVGRYEEFRGLKGNVIDPQTRQRIPDAYVSLTAELIATGRAEREAAAALTDAAARLIALEKAHLDFNPAELPASLPNPPKPLRQPGIDAELDLLRLALRQNAGYAPAWFAARLLADDGKLTLAQKKLWSNELLKLCGQRYPDFALTVLTPMIETVDDPREQDALWIAAFRIFQARSDLAASILMARAQLWEQQKNVPLAGQCYLEVIDKYVDAGPFVLAALLGAEDLLRNSGKTDRIVALYEQTWAKCRRPEGSASQFMQQSNWYRVGSMLVDKLVDARQDQRAAAVRAQLQAALGKPR